MHPRSHLRSVHRGERLGALVLHERGIGAICSAQKPSALEPVDLAEQVVGPGEPFFELGLPLGGYLREMGDCDEHGNASISLMHTVQRCRAPPTPTQQRPGGRLSSLLHQPWPNCRGSMKMP